MRKHNLPSRASVKCYLSTAKTLCSGTNSTPFIPQKGNTSKMINYKEAHICYSQTPYNLKFPIQSNPIFRTLNCNLEHLFLHHFVIEVEPISSKESINTTFKLSIHFIFNINQLTSHKKFNQPKPQNHPPQLLLST